MYNLREEYEYDEGEPRLADIPNIPTVTEDIDQYDTTYQIVIDHQHSHLVREAIYDVVSIIKEEANFAKALNMLLNTGFISDIDYWTEELPCYGSENNNLYNCDECAFSTDHYDYCRSG